MQFCGVEIAKRPKRSGPDSSPGPIVRRYQVPVVLNETRSHLRSDQSAVPYLFWSGRGFTLGPGLPPGLFILEPPDPVVPLELPELELFIASNTDIP